MCMRKTEEGCILAEQQAALKKEVSSLDERIDKLESEFASMRSETQDGFKQGAVAMREISASVSNLAHDFGQRFNNIETTVVAEKVKWGETLRWLVKKTAIVILAGAAVAMGVSSVKGVIDKMKMADLSAAETR